MARAPRTKSTGRRPSDNTTGQVKWYPIDRLKAYDRNSRTHSPEQLDTLSQSLEEFGWVKPILVQEDGTIVAGHGIVQAAEQAGYTEAKALVVTGMTDAQVRAYVIADNQLALNAGWDPELLRLELNQLEGDGFKPDQLGFTDEDVARLLDAEPLPAKRKRRDQDTATFSTPLPAIDLATLRAALEKAKSAYGVDSTSAALMAIITSWNEENDSGE